MKITKDTLLKEFTVYQSLDLLKSEVYDEIRSKVGKSNFEYLNMSLGDFALLHSGKMPDFLLKEINREDITVFEYFRFENGLKLAIDQFIKLLEDSSIEQTAEEVEASLSIPKMNLIESLLCFVKTYFNLTNFELAEKISLLEIALAKKDVYIQRLFERNIQKIHERKINNSRKGAKK